jgi:hypothetical protein
MGVPQSVKNEISAWADMSELDLCYVAQNIMMMRNIKRSTQKPDLSTGCSGEALDMKLIEIAQWFKFLTLGPEK